MLSKVFSYPKTFDSFMQWCYSNEKYVKIYKDLGKICLFDVSLRDGLQGLSKTEQATYNTPKKIQVYNQIVENHSPHWIECGSIVSNKVYPVFKDTCDLFRYANSRIICNRVNNKKIDNFIFIPSYDKLIESFPLSDCTHFSFISSVSENFLLKNIKKNFETNYNELSQMVSLLHSINLKKNKIRIENPKEYKTKLYVSCINECPIDRKISNTLVVDRLIKLYSLQFNTICLSDTCGTLEPHDFIYIVDECNRNGIPYSAMSLHLHVKRNREQVVEQIIHEALKRRINQFDVSILETGGCSVTIKKENLCPNLSYELYYQFLVNYIIKSSER
jgi:isopropylmalate/homocitrate/citramalate synthase